MTTVNTGRPRSRTLAAEERHLDGLCGAAGLAGRLSGGAGYRRSEERLELGAGGLGPRESDHQAITDMEGRDSQVLDPVLLAQRNELLEGLAVLLDVADLDVELGPPTPKLLEEREGRCTIGTALAREHLDVRSRRIGSGGREQEHEHHESGDDSSHTCRLGCADVLRAWARLAEGLGAARHSPWAS
jgi:hypothetical protein